MSSHRREHREKKRNLDVRKTYHSDSPAIGAPAKFSSLNPELKSIARRCDRGKVVMPAPKLPCHVI